VLGGYRKYSIDCCTLAKLHCSCTTTYLDLLLLLLLAGPIALRPPVSCVASFSGAASKTLKNLLPPGDTSKMLAMFPHLLRSDDSWKSEQATVTHL
jgi:hypothetical protein